MTTAAMAAAGDAVLAEEGEPYSFSILVMRARDLAERPYQPVQTVSPDQPIRDGGPVPVVLEALNDASADNSARLFVLPSGPQGGLVSRIFKVRGDRAFEIRVPMIAAESGEPAEEPSGEGDQTDSDPVFAPLGGVEIERCLVDPHAPARLQTIASGRLSAALGSAAPMGSSARAVTIDTGLGRPEEFAVFREFYVSITGEAPRCQIEALLDGPRVVGAFRFSFGAANHAGVDVEATFFFREEIDQIGLAALDSMFLFGPNDRNGLADPRARVHDAEALQIWMQDGTAVWRPLVNPDGLRVSVFEAVNPRGFGLVQRSRGLRAYEDLDHRYDLRPTVWVVPRGSWGKGAIRLLEIPLDSEHHDNIVAFWAPEEPTLPGRAYYLAYSIFWLDGPPVDTGLATVRRSATGAVPDETDAVRVVVDFDPPTGMDALVAGENVVVEADAWNAQLLSIDLVANEEDGGYRVMMDVRPTNNEAVELRAVLVSGERVISETWLYRLDKS